MLKKFYFLGAIFWTITIVVLSLISFSKVPEVFSEFSSYDKLVHFVFYFVFVFLWGNFIFYDKQIQSRTLFLIFWLALIFGGVMEFCQEFFTEKRTAEINDMVANFVGALAGMGAVYLYKKIKKLWKSNNI